VVRHRTFAQVVSALGFGMETTLCWYGSWYAMIITGRYGGGTSRKRFTATNAVWGWTRYLFLAIKLPVAANPTWRTKTVGNECLFCSIEDIVLPLLDRSRKWSTLAVNPFESKHDTIGKRSCSCAVPKHKEYTPVGGLSGCCLPTHTWLKMFMKELLSFSSIDFCSSSIPAI
jgi:hypothetical protein